MKVLSLFDGMSCGRIALERSGITVDAYYASEIDKSAIAVSKANWSDIIHIGDVTKLSFKDGVLHTETGSYDVGDIDLVIAGSPCQGFSFAGIQLAFNDPRSKLYFEFERILREVQPKWFILENVNMKQDYKDFISDRIGVKPVTINSNTVSAQNRQRLYWSNLPIMQPINRQIFLYDIIQNDVESTYYCKPDSLSWLKNYGIVNDCGGLAVFSCTDYSGSPFMVQRPHGSNKGGIRGRNGKVPALTVSSWQYNNLIVDNNNIVRRITPLECERLQTVPDGYTSFASDSQRYRMLGNGWTVDVIVHILQSLNEVINKLNTQVLGTLDDSIEKVLWTHEGYII